MVTLILGLIIDLRLSRVASERPVKQPQCFSYLQPSSELLEIVVVRVITLIAVCVQPAVLAF